MRKIRLVDESHARRAGGGICRVSERISRIENLVSVDKEKDGGCYFNFMTRAYKQTLSDLLSELRRARQVLTPPGLRCPIVRSCTLASGSG